MVVETYGWKAIPTKEFGDRPYVFPLFVGSDNWTRWDLFLIVLRGRTPFQRLVLSPPRLQRNFFSVSLKIFSRYRPIYSRVLSALFGVESAFP